MPAAVFPEFTHVADPTITPSHLRIRPDVGWPAPQDVLTKMGDIFVAKDRGSLRTIVTGGIKHVTGWYPSYKAKRTQHWQGIPERTMVHVSEVDPSVVDYQTQPFRFEFAHGGSRHIYIADLWRLRSDGTNEIIEVKRDDKDLRDPEYRFKLACVAEICRRLDWTFAVYLKDEITTSLNHARNVELVQSRRFASVTADHVSRLSQHAEQVGIATTYGRVSAALEPDDHLIGNAVAQALMVRRRLSIDIKNPLHPDSAVVILPASNAQHQQTRH